MKVGRRLLKLRKRLGLTQAQFAELVKVDYTYIGKIERNDQYPSIKMLEKIGRVFNKPLLYWFEEDSKVEEVSKRVHRMGNKVRGLVCLLHQYMWDEGRFAAFPDACSDFCPTWSFCKAVKTLVEAKEIQIEKEKK